MVMCINSKTSHLEETKNIVKEKQFPKYLIISPSVIQGVSIDSEYYDCMICVYKCKSIDASDMLQ